MTDFKAEASLPAGMTLLQRLKALFGLDSSGQQTRDDDIDVTVTHPQTGGTTPDDGDTNASPTTEAAEEPTPDSTTTDVDPSQADDAGTDTDPVDTIDGIGPAYSDRLHSVGIETVADLATADPQAIAAETDLSPARVERWIDRASQRT